MTERPDSLGAGADQDPVAQPPAASTAVDQAQAAAGTELSIPVDCLHNEPNAIKLSWKMARYSPLNGMTALVTVVFLLFSTLLVSEFVPFSGTAMWMIVAGLVGWAIWFKFTYRMTGRKVVVKDRLDGRPYFDEQVWWPHEEAKWRDAWRFQGTKRRVLWIDVVDGKPGRFNFIEHRSGSTAQPKDFAEKKAEADAALALMRQGGSGAQAFATAGVLLLIGICVFLTISGSANIPEAFK